MTFKKKFEIDDRVTFSCFTHSYHAEKATVTHANHERDSYNIKLDRGGTISIVSACDLVRITDPVYKNPVFISRMLKTN